MPKPDDIEPLAGQMSVPEPWRIGPATPPPPLEPRRRASTAACSRSSACTWPSSSARSACVERQHRRLVGAHRGVRVATAHELRLDLHDLLDLGLDRRGHLLGAPLEPVEALGEGRGLRLGLAHALDDAGVLRGHALHELGPLEQVGEAVGLEHDGHDVGLVGLVELDEPPGERDLGLRQPRPQLGEPQARAPQLLLDPGELLALRGEVGLEPHLLGLQHGDVALQGADPLADGADVGRQHALLAAALLDLRPLALDLPLQVAARLRARPDRERGPEGERQRRHQEQEAESSSHAARHARRPHPTLPLVMECATVPARCRDFPCVRDEPVTCSPRCAYGVS